MRWRPLAAAALAAAAACSAGDETPSEQALPETRTIEGIFDELPDTPRDRYRALGPDPEQFERWTRSHGDDYSSKYSSLDQIDTSNVADLELAWSVDTSVAGKPDGGWRFNVAHLDGHVDDAKWLEIREKWSKCNWMFKQGDVYAPYGWRFKTTGVPAVYVNADTNLEPIPGFSRAFDSNR